VAIPMGLFRCCGRSFIVSKETTIDLSVDNARWHKGTRVEEFNFEFFLSYQVLYHHELNYQERLWHAMRYEETTNVYFETISDLDHAVFNKRSQRWKPEKIKEPCPLN
jgi:hypothetical protein